MKRVKATAARGLHFPRVIRGPDDAPWYWWLSYTDRAGLLGALVLACDNSEHLALLARQHPASPAAAVDLPRLAEIQIACIGPMKLEPRALERVLPYVGRLLSEVDARELEQLMEALDAETGGPS